jgi:cytochrome c oxidase subunit 2
MRGSYQQRVSSTNKLNAVLLLVFLIAGVIGFIWITVSASENYLPDPVSEHGVRTDRMFWITMGILSFAFIVTNFFLFVFAYKYQYKEGNHAYFYPENHKLEIVWTVIPAIVMSVLVFYGWKEWSAITAPEPKESEVIEVMGKQFAWQVRYPGPDNKLGAHDFRLIDETNAFGIDLRDKASLDDFTPSEIHIPKGHPVLFKIRARDVIHSVFAPHFRLKMDAVPGMPTKFWFTPTKTTQEMRDQLGNPDFNYELACTEICGRGHFAMRYVIVVDEPEQYKAWKESQKSFVAQNIDYAKGKVPAELQSMLPAQEAPAESVPAPVAAPDTTALEAPDSTTVSAPSDSAGR